MLTPVLMEKLQEQFKTFPHPLDWVNPDLKNNKSIASLIEDAGKEYAKLYDLCNPEVHCSYSGTPRHAVLTNVTPRRLIPFTAWGQGTFFKDFKELEFDFRVTKILVRIIELAPSFLPRKIALLKGQ